MPVAEGGYYWLARYYGPTSRPNGNTAVVGAGAAVADWAKGF